MITSFDIQKFFNFGEVQLIFSFVACPLKKILFNWRIITVLC